MSLKNDWKLHVEQVADKVNADGCSDSPDFFYKVCCDAHDIAYRTGKDENGIPISRSEADKRLFACMQQAGKTPVIGTHILPAIYWAAVRLFGGKAWKG